MPSIVKTVPFDSVQWDLNGRPTVPNFFKTTTTGGPLQTRATQTVPRMDLVGRIVALDCEFQEVYIEALGKCRHRVGRVSIVNYYGDVIYDVFAWYPEEPGKRKKLPSPSMKLGVYWADIKLRNGACHIQEVEYNVNAILRKAEIVVGHAIHEDIKVFSEGFWKGIETRDTQAYSGYRKHNGGPKKLSVLSIEILDGSIQGEEHSSAEDAWATMSLFRVNEDGIEREQGGMMWQPLEDEGGDDAEYADELEEDPQSAEDAALEQAMVELQEARRRTLRPQAPRPLQLLSIGCPDDTTLFAPLTTAAGKAEAELEPAEDAFPTPNAIEKTYKTAYKPPPSHTVIKSKEIALAPSTIPSPKPIAPSASKSIASAKIATSPILRATTTTTARTEPATPSAAALWSTFTKVSLGSPAAAQAPESTIKDNRGQGKLVLKRRQWL